MSSLASATREAVRERPFLLAALRAGVCNYAAAARRLDVGGDPEAVAAALRRYAADLPEYATESRAARVRMCGGVGPADGADALLTVGDRSFAPDSGSLTAIVADGDVDAAALGGALARLRAEDVGVEAAAVADGTLVAVVDRRDGATALRLVEGALEAVPDRGSTV